MFCFVSFVYLLADVNSNLSRLQDCTFSAPEKVCKCFLPDDEGRRLLKFSAVQSCMSVKENLRNLVYGVSVLFGVGFIISMITAIASSWLLYAEQKKNLQVGVLNGGIAITMPHQILKYVNYDPWLATIRRVADNIRNNNATTKLRGMKTLRFDEWQP